MALLHASFLFSGTVYGSRTCNHVGRFYALDEAAGLACEIGVGKSASPIYRLDAAESRQLAPCSLVGGVFKVTAEAIARIK